MNEQELKIVAKFLVDNQEEIDIPSLFDKTPELQDMIIPCGCCGYPVLSTDFNYDQDCCRKCAETI